MASLLDIFGGSGSDIYGGLLGEEGLAQAKRQAQADALMNLSASLLKAGAPSRTPQGLGLGLVEGMQSASKGYKSAMDTALQEKMTQAKIAEALAAKKRTAGAQELLQTALQPQLQATATTGPSGVPYPVNQVGMASLQDLIPQFAKYGTEGFEALKQYTDLQKAVRPETVTLSEGQQLFERTPTGLKSIAGVPKVKPLKEVDLGNVVVLLNEQGQEVGRLPKGRAPEGAPTLQHIETAEGIAAFNPKTGQITPVMQGGKQVVGKGAGTLTDAQGNAVAYGMRMIQADKILKPLENAGLKDTGMIRSGVSGTLGAVPLIGDALARGSDNIFNTLPTILGGLSEDQQKTVQARVNFVTAVLRKESGASISPTEFATAEKNYFPAPGDSQAIVKQKQQARELAIKAMKAQAGTAGSKFFTESNGVTSSGW
jgi:hypothetical protein